MQNRQPTMRNRSTDMPLPGCPLSVVRFSFHCLLPLRLQIQQGPMLLRLVPMPTRFVLDDQKDQLPVARPLGVDQGVVRNVAGPPGSPRPPACRSRPRPGQRSSPCRTGASGRGSRWMGVPGQDQLLLAVAHDVLVVHPPLEHDLAQLDPGFRVPRELVVRSGSYCKTSSDPP